MYLDDLSFLTLAWYQDPYANICVHPFFIAHKPISWTYIFSHLVTNKKKLSQLDFYKTFSHVILRFFLSFRLIAYIRHQVRWKWVTRQLNFFFRSYLLIISRFHVFSDEYICMQTYTRVERLTAKFCLVFCLIGTNNIQLSWSYLITHFELDDFEKAIRKWAHTDDTEMLLIFHFPSSPYLSNQFDYEALQLWIIRMIKVDCFSLYSLGFVWC